MRPPVFGLAGAGLSIVLTLCTGLCAAGDLPPHPRLMITDAEIPRIKARAELPDFKARYASLLKIADNWANKKVDLPPRGGQWPHWYVCKKDGGNLKTISPTEHKCPICGEVYSGWPYDDVVLMGVHGGYSNAVRDLGLAYRLTGQTKYGDKAKEILLAYAEKYPTYPLHDKNGKEKIGGGYVGAQTLDEAMWIIPVCQGADLVLDRFSAEQRKQLEDKVFRPGAEIIRKHKMSIHNIQCWKNSAVGVIGFFLNDKDLIADAIDSPWGFRQQVAKGINDDGQWYEGAWGYHFFTVSAMSPLLEAAHRAGVDLYGYQAEGHSYRMLLEGPLSLAMPNMVLPAFSDSGEVNVTSYAEYYELGLARYGEPRFAALLRQTRRNTLAGLLCGVPSLPAASDRESATRNYTSAGYAVLQQGNDANATWLCMKYGPHGGGHGHPDKLNFILYSRGEVLGFDPGTGKYGAPIHEAWQKASIAHNTLTVDQANQKGVTGSSLAFVSKPEYAAALADAGPIYSGVVYRRAVAVVGADMVLVLDLVSSDKDHTYDLAYHNDGRWVEAPKGTPAKLPDLPSYRYFADMVQAAAPLPLIEKGALKVGLAVASAGGGERLAGTGAGKTSNQRVPCVLWHVSGKRAVVAWAIHLGGVVPTVSVKAAEAGFVVQAGANGKTCRMTVNPEAKDKLKVE